MTILPRWISALALVALFHFSADGQSAAPAAAPPAWSVTSAPARLDIAPAQILHPCKIGVVELDLPDPNWANQTIRVYTDTGVAVGSDVLWTVPNGPVTLVFDSSLNAKNYRAYFGSNYPPMHLPDPKAGVWLERRPGNGQFINNLPDMLTAWNQSTPVVGRAIVPGIWEGGNRFGPQSNLLTHLQGWFDLPAAAHMQFGAISVDASFVLVDGKEVVESPGHHDRWWDGQKGPPQGGVDLAAGPHLVDYYNAYVLEGGDNPPPLTACLCAKGGPFPDWNMLAPWTPPLFRPFLQAHPSTYELQKDVPGAVATGTAPSLAIDWGNGDKQSVIYTDLADIGFISMRFTCLRAVTGTVTWTFDDGTTAQGTSVEHLFPRPGARIVHVSVTDGGKETASLTQTVAVGANWADARQPPELVSEHEADILARDPATLSASDLAGCFAMFVHYLKLDDLVKLLPAMTAKTNDLSDGDLPYVTSGALLLAHEDWAHGPDEIQLLRALIDRCGKGTPSAPSAVIASEARLALARLLYKSSDKLDEVKSLVAAIDPKALSDREPRILQILNADVALADGDIPGARKQYESLTGEPTGPDVRSSIRQIAKIGQARAYIDRKDFDAAEDSLNEVAWQAPVEKLSPDWALTRLRLYQEENLPVPAYVWAKRLLPVITDTSRAELLFRATDLAFAQNDNDLASKTLAELLKKHPYSEEAAQAKEKWPGKG